MCNSNSGAAERRGSVDFPGGPVVKDLPANAGTQVRFLVPKDPTCCGATKPGHHNHQAYALKLVCHNCSASEPQLRKPAL